MLLQKTAAVDNTRYKEFYAAYREAFDKSRAQVVFSKRQGGVASEELEEAVRREPASAGAIVSLVKDYLRRGKYREAKDLLDRGVIMEPANGEIRYLLGISCGYLDLREESKKALSKAKELGYKP